MQQQGIERINELSRLARERALTGDEQAERAALRAAYIADMKRSLQSTLDNTYVVDADGNEKPLRESGAGGREPS